MRLARLDLIRYGNFTARSLEFAAGAADLHLICGANEAGKSTAKAAIEDLLFGFGKATSYAFAHEPSSLRVGARVEGGASELEVRRRKGNKETLLGSDERPIAQDSLRALMGGADREFFERMWCLDHTRLGDGGRQILDGAGDVGQMLFEASAGLGGLREHLEKLEREAEDIYKPRKSEKLTFYAAHARLTAADNVLRDARVTAGDWQKQRDALDARHAERVALLGSMSKKKAARVRLERIRRVLPTIGELSRIELGLAALGTPVTMPTDADALLQSAEQSQVAAEQSLRQLDEQDRSLALELERVVVDDALLAKEVEIDALNAKRGAASKARDDRARRRTELVEKEKRLAVLQEEIGQKPLLLEQVEAGLPARPKVARLRALLEERSAHDAVLAASVDEKNRLGDDQREVQQDLGQRLVPPDLALLAGTAQEVRSRLELGSELRRARGECDTLSARVASAVAALRPFHGEVEVLRALPVPAAAIIHAMRVRLQDGVERARAVEVEWTRAGQSVTQLRSVMKQLLRTGSGVAGEEVAVARELRDRTWSLVKRRHVEGLVLEEAELRELQVHADLPGLFESRTRDADGISDRRFLGAKDSALLDDSEHRIEAEEAQVARLEQERRTLDEARRASLREWSELWSGCGFAPDAPEVMADWSKQRLVALALADERCDRERQLAALREEDAALCARLVAALSSGGASVGSSDTTSLAQLLALADERVKQVTGELNEQKLLATQLQKATSRLAVAQRKLDAATEKLAEWESSWQTATASAGRPAEESREATRAALSVIDEIRELVGQARELSERIRKIDEDVTSFDADAGRLASLLGARGEQLLPIAVAEALAEALKTHRGQQAKRDTLEGEQKKRQTERQHADGLRARADSQVAQLLRAAHCESVDDLRRALATAREHQALRARLELELQRLVKEGDGVAQTELERECREVDRDHLPAEVERLAGEIDVDAERLRAMDLAVAEAARELEQIAGDEVAAGAAADRQLALAEIQEEGQRYLKLHTASVLLRWAMERHRQTKQGPLLARAAVLFRGLTCGSFALLRIDRNEKDELVLLGMRSDGSQVPVDGMSDGTRDQLYLALRLAAIDEQLAAAAPLPFVADDLFINFDDTRAAAGFQALAGLAGKTQVLFFTHHEHLIDVATAAVGAGNLSVHRL